MRIPFSSQNTVEMYNGPIAGQIIRFTVPLFIGNLFQQLYNAVDALIVGNMLGNEALAAVSTTSSLIYMLIGFLEGIFIGAGVAISRYFGARDDENLSKSIHTNLAFCLTAGVILSVISSLFSEDILQIMATPEDILPAAALYMRIYSAGILTVMLYNCCRGIMQAVGDSVHPLLYLIISSVTNVILDIAFIAWFHGGVGSAALATVISQGLSAILCMIRLIRTKDVHRVQLKKISFDIPMLGKIIHYGLPSGFQNSAIAIANVLVQSNINAFGTMAIAGCGAYSKIEGFVFLPISSFVLALTTFIGQNLGAGRYDRARKGARFGIWCSVITAELIGIVTFFFIPAMIRAFTSEPEAIAYGIQKAKNVSLFFVFLSATHSLAGVLRGAGKSLFPMMCYFLVWGVFRVVYLSLVVPIFNSIVTVNMVYPITWSITTIILFIYYFKADWIHGFDKERSR